MIDVVCAIIRDDEGRLLAGLRPQGKFLGGMWEFPGGKVDPGESPEEALAREIREELDLEITVAGALEPVDWQYEKLHIRLLPYVCTICRGEMKLMSHEQVSWFTINELDLLEWAPADVPILAQVRTMFANDSN